MQFKILQARQDFEEREITRRQDSVKTLAEKKRRGSGKIPDQSTFKTLATGCTVTASFTPNDDTTLYTGQGITFTNTSQNADSYEWIVDHYPEYSTTDLDGYVPSVGITPITLVAHQGTCTDTATVTYLVRNGTPPTDLKRMTVNYGLPSTNEFGSTLVTAKKDGYLLGGISGQSTNGYFQPYFVRVSETGCVLWSTLLAGTAKPELHTLITTYDSGFVVEVVQKDDSYHTFLLKLDKNGNVVWEHNYQGVDGIDWTGSIKELSDHSLMLMSGKFANKNFLLSKLNEFGGFIWQKTYGYGEQDEEIFSDLVENNGYALVAGNYYQAVDPMTNKFNYVSMLFNIDLANGNLQWVKGYVGVNKFCSVSGLHFYKNGLIMNGFADSLVDPVNGGYTNMAFLQEMDLNGNLGQSTAIHLPDQLNAPIGNDLIIDEHNNIEFFYSGEEALSLQPYYADLSYYLRLDQNKNILWQQEYFGYGVGYINQAAASPSKGIAMLGSRVNSVFDPIYGLSENMVMLKVDSNGTGPDQFCDQYTPRSLVLNSTVTSYMLDPPVVTDQFLLVTDEHYPASKPNSEIRYKCPDYVPLCSFMKLSGKNAVCNLKDTLDFIAHKDPSCNDPVKWTYDISNIETAFLDGGKLRLLFKTPGVYKIFAEKPYPCASILDSIFVTVAPGLINFNLGNDTSLCAEDTLLLKPTGKYNQYLWQDGSIKDSFVAKMPGDYHLMVTDSCGNTKTATINVAYKAALAVDLGPARSICLLDTVAITPPPGFLQYDWTPDYHLLHGANGSVMLFPEVETEYNLTVHDNSSCTGRSQLDIQIFPANRVSAGNDTTICTGTEAHFTAVGNFDSYSWSNGETTASIDVQNAGKYVLVAEDQNLCKSADTVKLSVYPSPIVSFDGRKALCVDQNLLLDAGAGFESYLWQDGSRLEQFNVTDTGTYHVQVTDSHQCAGDASVFIPSFTKPPQQFLPGDTVVCNYSGALLMATRNFIEYEWSNGETGNAIHVQSAGQYILQVVDDQGCIGRDSTNVELKNCDAILVFPNAFTPNHDGINDVFRLKYPGRALNYQLQVFDRWGQRVFVSADPFAGWNGTLGGIDQPAGTYVWVTRYLDGNGQKRIISGTVLLIR